MQSSYTLSPAKRGFDIIAALLMLAILWPLIVLLSLGTWAIQGRPVLFSQMRSGLGGREFRLRKFRSMRDVRDERGEPLPDEQRVTSLGRFLRRTRLDELPELFQILSGSLSLVGPRPLPHAAILSDPLGRHRLNARPGLTGMAQVSGNTLLTHYEKFAIDAYYVGTASLTMDLDIVLRTALVVLFGERRDEALIEKAMAYANGLDRRG